MSSNQQRNHQRQEIVENMYIDPSNEQSEFSMSDQNDDVKEATEALKGMLGLGSSSAAVAEIGTAAPNGEAETPEASNQNKSKRKKRPNKKKKPQGGAESSPPRPKQKETSGPANKSKQKNKKSSSSQQNPKSQPGTSENFAWSAFQSSPDASKLPIPAFSPTTPTTKDTLQDLPDDEEIPNLNLTDEKASSTEKVEQAIPPKQVEIEDATKGEGTGLNMAAGPLISTNAPPSGPIFPPSRLQMPPPPPPPPPSFFSPPMSHAYAPPGFVTIRVQLPPVLPANRTLIVANPAGFPVQVHIPEEYAPNQIISVNVPSGPPLPAMPYHHG